jgi:trk system potassium uptake protein TrkH
MAVDKAFTVITLFTILIIGGTLLLSAVGFSHPPLAHAPGQPVGVLFEAISALCTTGLTTGITPTLTPGGKIVVILLMFVGRLGPLTIALSIARLEPAPAVRLAEERIMIG